MSVLNRLIDRMRPTDVAHAHCDIPCGIYHPHDALQAADTVIRMTELMQEQEQKGLDGIEAHNAMARYVQVKEEHAEKCKRETLILWSDYFKPPHLEQFPDLHEKVWHACKTASYTKQHVDMEQARKLKSQIEEIADIFWETKK
ncbi:MAG: superoxide dismutase, Ni [Chloroflexota bacterium]